MENEIKKTIMHSAYPSAHFTAEVLSEGDAIVPDSKPDIEEILLCEGRAAADKTELQNGRVIINGTAYFTVLYKPESEGNVCSVSLSLPFNHIASIETVSPDDKACLTLDMADCSCSLINSRKLSLKGIIALCFASYSDISFPVYTDINIPEIELKKETVVSSSVGASKSASFSVSDILPLHESDDDIDELLLCRPVIKDSTLKLVPGKAVIKGSLSVTHLYLSEGGTLEYITHEIPFTEICDVPELTEDMTPELILSVGSVSSHKDPSPESSHGAISLNAEINMCLLAFSTVAESAVVDAYLPGSASDLEVAKIKKSEIIDTFSESVTVKDSAELPIDMPPMEKICPIFAFISSHKTECENGKVTFSGTVTAIINYISDGCIYSFKKDTDFKKEFSCPSGNFFITSRARVSYSDYNFINQAKADIRSIIELFVTLRQNDDDFSSINSVQINGEEKLNFPSVVIYFVKSGDTLWDIAKRYKTTVDKILFANKMDGTEILNSGMRLLIPA